MLLYDGWEGVVYKHLPFITPHIGDIDILQLKILYNQFIIHDVYILCLILYVDMS